MMLLDIKRFRSKFKYTQLSSKICGFGLNSRPFDSFDTCFYIHSVRVAAMNGIPFNSRATVFVGDLAVSCDESHLYEMFIEFGLIYSIKLMRTRKNLSLGYAFVTYLSMDNALSAIQNLNGKALCGRNIRTSFATQSQDLQKFDKSTVYFSNSINEVIQTASIPSQAFSEMKLQLPI